MVQGLVVGSPSGSQTQNVYSRGFSGPALGNYQLENPHMRILLYNPDNGSLAIFMPHLWMFLLQSLTPGGHEVV